MVCLGNICRSPMAEGLMQSKILKHNLNALVDSAGFEPYHSGDKPDYRACEVMRNHGIDITKQRARLFKPIDFENFDRIYVMDSGNYRDVCNTTRNPVFLAKVDYILNAINKNSNQQVPDPYYGGKDGFEEVFRLLDKATDSIAIELKSKSL